EGGEAPDHPSSPRRPGFSAGPIRAKRTNMRGAADHSGLEPAEQGNRYQTVPVDLGPPDLEISLQLDPHAPRAARYHVAQVDRPSPDLRDAVILLTSELVTRAAQYSRPGSDEAVQLPVWMPADLLRVQPPALRHL